MPAKIHGVRRPREERVRSEKIPASGEARRLTSPPAVINSASWRSLSSGNPTKISAKSRRFVGAAQAMSWPRHSRQKRETHHQATSCLRLCTTVTGKIIVSAANVVGPLRILVTGPRAQKLCADVVEWLGLFQVERFTNSSERRY